LKENKNITALETINQDQALQPDFSGRTGIFSNWLSGCRRLSLKTIIYPFIRREFANE